MVQAQSIIAAAQNKVVTYQKRAMFQAIQPTYPSREGQKDALYHLICRWKDILTAKTSFGKSMILQAASVLIRMIIGVIILSLNLIWKEQAETIARISGQPCFLVTIF